MAAGVEVSDLAGPAGHGQADAEGVVRDAGSDGVPETVSREREARARHRPRRATPLPSRLPWTCSPRAGRQTPRRRTCPRPGRLSTLRRRFHQLGAANPFAVDEYRAVRERLETLDAQDRDLREAIGKTRTLIADLDVLIANQFRTTFAALEVAFDARFQQLFGGGFAKLSLTDPADLSATGIEITARPPGKKPQGVDALGRRARPHRGRAPVRHARGPPRAFCVLDGVHAPLDEVNVGRFNDVLRDLAAWTQFIVITHNRGTIEAADALYGVTVGDDSVSRVISLRLDEAQAIASHRRTEAHPVPAGDRGGHPEERD